MNSVEALDYSKTCLNICLINQPHGLVLPRKYDIFVEPWGHTPSAKLAVDL